jgi:murein DD-endopeptidase MepM/ murein hydrolase activator NlpD
MGKIFYFCFVVVLMYFFFYDFKNKDSFVVFSNDKNPIEKSCVDNFKQENKTTGITKWLVNNCEVSKNIFENNKSNTIWVDKEVFYIEYKVKKNDTLYSIAKMYGTTVEQITNDNNLYDNNLVIGKNLKIIDSNHIEPKTKVEKSGKNFFDGNIAENYKEVDDSDGKFIYYKVDKSENLIQVASKFDMSLEELKTINNLQNDLLFKDQILKVKYKLEKIEKTKLNFMWPILGRVISSFGVKERGEKNEGINIQAKVGADVKASENGVVTYVGDQIKSFGVIVLIQHDNEWISAYAYLKESNLKKGDYVKKGQVVGKIGLMKEIGIPQLHFELRKNIESINPLLYLNSHR